MAGNFRIDIHRNSDSLHLKLSGDFDGTSAQQLIHILDQNLGRAPKVFIHTACLRQVYPFGQSIFRNGVHAMNGKNTPLTFTGEKASCLAPERNSLP